MVRPHLIFLTSSYITAISGISLAWGRIAKLRNPTRISVIKTVAVISSSISPFSFNEHMQCNWGRIRVTGFSTQLRKLPNPRDSPITKGSAGRQNGNRRRYNSCWLGRRNFRVAIQILEHQVIHKFAIGFVNITQA